MTMLLRNIAWSLNRMSTRTLNMVRGRLYSVFSEAVHEQLIYSNPVTATRRIKGHDGGEASRGIALEHPQAWHLTKLGFALFEAGECRLWPAIFTAISAGLRRGEVMGLRWADTDLEIGKLRVTQNLTDVDGKPVLDRPKTKNSSREIVIPEALWSVLKIQRQQMESEYSMRGETIKADSPVFATSDGQYPHPANLRRALASVLRWSDPEDAPVKRERTGVKPRTMTMPLSSLERRLKVIPCEHRARLRNIIRGGAPLPRISPHDLRHTAATLMLTQPDAQVSVVSEMLGHANSTMTMNGYRHVMPSERAKRVIDLFPMSQLRAVSEEPLN